MGRRMKYTSKFKTKVVLEALKERSSLKELAVKYEVHQQQISNWKRAFLDEAEGIFEGKVKTAKTEAEEERDRLLKTIGELKVENDFYRKSCDDPDDPKKENGEQEPFHPQYQ